MNVKEIVVRCTDGSTMRGKVNIGDKFSRLSDWIVSNKDEFMTVFDATSEGEVDQVIIVNKAHVIWIMPVGEG